MRDDQVAAALDRLAPPTGGAHAGWVDVERRAVRLRRRRRRGALGACVVAGVALFSTLAASGQIGSFASHSKAPHLVVRATLARADGARAGTIEIELQRAAVVLGPPVRLLRWRTPDEHGFSARWFLRLRGRDRVRLARGSLAFGRSAVALTLCRPCGAGASGEVELSAARASALVENHATFRGAFDDGMTAAGELGLDRSRLRRAVLCISSTASCTRIYTGRP